MTKFSHVDNNNRPCMVDVSEKIETVRFAHARSLVWLPEKVREHFIDGEIQSKKGPVFQTAIIAGTMALKKTAETIPFCHQLNIESSSITLELKGEEVVIDCKVKTCGKTGVEMEALVGAGAAALTVYDMCKAFGHEMEITCTRLIEKTGGKSDFKKM